MTRTYPAFASAKATASFRLVAKSRQGRSWSSPGTPRIASRTIACVPSDEPVSTTTHERTNGRTEARQRAMTRASSLTIIARQTVSSFCAFALAMRSGPTWARAQSPPSDLRRARAERELRRRDDLLHGELEEGELRLDRQRLHRRQRGRADVREHLRDTAG